MEANLLVSVIIPVFNVRPYLSEALDSVIKQSYSNLEILIIDDGSTDGSGEICEEYSEDPRVQVIHQENKGLSAARNVGLDMMTGDIVAFLDPDDKYHTDFIRLMMEGMVREEADIIICKYSYHESTGRIITTGKEKTSPPAGQGLYDKYQSLSYLADGIINLSVWNKLYRNELWKEIRFPEGHVYEDIFTTYKVFNCCSSVFVLDFHLYCKRLHDSSITRNCTLERIHDRLLARQKVDEFIAANIPDIFTQEQLEKRSQDQLKILIIFYIFAREKFGRY